MRCVRPMHPVELSICFPDSQINHAAALPGPAVFTHNHLSDMRVPEQFSVNPHAWYWPGGSGLLAIPSTTDSIASPSVDQHSS